MMRRRGLSRGFGLAEALVALLIAGGVLAAFYDAVSVGTTLRNTLDRRSQLALEAFALLDTFEDERPLRPGLDERGRTNGLDWRVTVTTDAPQGFLAPAGSTPGALLHVYVSVAPPDRPDLAFRLHALRYRERPI